MTPPSKPTDFEYLNALCREKFDAFTEKGFCILQPGRKFVYSWHLGCIAEHLEAVYRGEIKRLIINEPPRMLKSVQVAQLYPAWVFIKEPHHQFIGTSYASKLAKRNVLQTRTLIQSDWYKIVAPHVKLASEAAEHFTTTKNGQYMGAGITGTATGFGCFTGETKVLTDSGWIKMSDIKLGINCTKALSYNHNNGNVEWKPIQAMRVIMSDDLYEITTKKETLRCTGNHPIYADGSYKPADTLRGGEQLIRVPFVQKDGNQSQFGIIERFGSWCKAVVLFPCLRQHTQEQNRINAQEVFFLRGNIQTIAEEKLQIKVLQRSVLWKFYKESARHILQTMWQGVSRSLAPTVLFGTMCGQSSFETYEGDTKPTLYTRKMQAVRVSKDKAVNQRTRWQRLRSLWLAQGNQEQAHEPSCSPHRREPSQQQTGKFDNTLSLMSYDTPQVETDTVYMVRRLRAGQEPVYDLQIADNHNFFVNGILAHNCDTLLLDDILNPQEAASDTMRASTLEAMRNTFFSRFNDERTAKTIMIMQRLHDDDPTGNLLRDGGWHHLVLPAEAPKRIQIDLGNKRWVMEAGDLLAPSRLNRQDLEQKKLDLGLYNYEGQFQQAPVPLGGGEFKDGWVQYYQPGSIKPHQMNVAILIDQAGGEEFNKKKRKLSDWSVILVIGLGPDNNYYLLDGVRDRFNPTERIDTIFMLHRKWNEMCGKPPKVGAEQVGLATDNHYINEKKKQDSYHFPVVPLKVNTRVSKEERIRQLIPIMQAHRFYVPASLTYMDGEGRIWDLSKELVDVELKTFPKSRYDDLIDCAAHILNPDLAMVFPKQKLGMVKKAYNNSDNDISDWRNF
jgi:predicted phage terminase large subunit-like protein